MLNTRRYCCENKGMELYGWCIMSSPIHMIIGSHGDAPENIMRDIKRYSSIILRKAIQTHPSESRREWMLWMMERAGKQNSNNINFRLWQ
ncbi:transposase [Chitinophagaceae bacterium LWZ2-11]